MSIKNTLIEFIQGRLAARGFRITRVPFPDDRPFSVLELLSDRLPPIGADFSVVQIGANDGCTGDLLCDLIKSRGWKALLVEPQPGPFAMLQTTYRDYVNVRCVQCAIAHEDGEATLWCVEGEGEITQFASFSRAVMLKQSRHIPDIERRLRPVKVPSQKLSTLLDDHGISHVDLFQVDTEGFDYEIIKMLFATDFRPPIISFENTHLSPADKNACARDLAAQAYSYISIGRDTIAWMDPAASRGRDGRDAGLLTGMEIHEAFTKTAAVVARRDSKQPGRVH
jgi:FkbM family methyltransferase